MSGILDKYYTPEGDEVSEAEEQLIAEPQQAAGPQGPPPGTSTSLTTSSTTRRIMSDFDPMKETNEKFYDIINQDDWNFEFAREFQIQDAEMEEFTPPVMHIGYLHLLQV